MDFEYNLEKSKKNQEKHGISFERAGELWQDPELLIIPARTEDEPRFLAIGKIGKKHWTAIYTERGEKIRLISVRRSRKEERLLYES